MPPSAPMIETSIRKLGFKPDIWLYLHNEGYDFAGKRARAATDGAKAWVDPDGFRKWVTDQREKFGAAVKREQSPPGEMLKPSKS
jgi:metallo-beta-lactamase class B